MWLVGIKPIRYKRCNFKNIFSHFLHKWNHGCLPFDRKMRLGCRKHNGMRFTSLPLKCHIRFGLNPKKGEVLSWVWNRERTEKLVNGKQYSVWFVPTGMKGLPQNVLLNFRLEFPKSELTIYLPSGISEIFCQMVRTPCVVHYYVISLSFFNIWTCGRLTVLCCSVHIEVTFWTGNTYFLCFSEKQDIMGMCSWLNS